MWRFEDKGLTLRLFKDVQDAKNHPESETVLLYGPGVICKNKQGHWFDAHGVLPYHWVPNSKLIRIQSEI